MFCDADNILRVIKEAGGVPEEFVSKEEHDETYEQCEEIVRALEGLWDCEVIFRCGATKAVFIPNSDEYNFVVKIPFTAIECWEEVFEDGYCDDNGDEYEEGEWRPYHQELCGGSLPISHERTWDYCSVEEELYELAEQRHLEKYFAEVSWIGEVFGHPIYVAEKCWALDESIGDVDPILPTGDSITKVREMSKSANRYINRFFDIQFLASILERDGEEAVWELTKFVSDYDINDLDERNLGVRKDGFGVMIDYSGYGE